MNHCERGAEGNVCASCLEDTGLQDFAKAHGQIQSCDYCGSTPKTPSIVDLESVVEFMRDIISHEWCDPAETLPYESAEGGYIGEVLEPEELFEKIGIEVSNGRLMNDIILAFSEHPWSARDWQLLAPSERWMYGWERFQHVVKHERRYSFWYDEGAIEDCSHPDYLPPSGFLAEIATTLERSGL